jgi:uncharacterized repeat protein (TIGR01451 family)
MKKIIFRSLLSLVWITTFGQSPFITHNYPKVSTPDMSPRIDFYDMDNDGDEDLVSWPEYTSIPIRIHLSNGIAIDSLNYIEIETQITGSLADWDQDGLMDIVGEDQGYSNFKVIRNLGGMSFAPEQTVATFSLNDATVCNLDSDGFPDLASWSLNSIQLFRNIDGFSTPQTYNITSPTQLNSNSSITFSDIENDGLKEMFVRNQMNKIYIYTQTGTFNYVLEDSIVSTTLGNPVSSSIDFTDLNNDGYGELIVRNGWNVIIYDHTSGYSYSPMYTANFSYSVSTGFGFPSLNDLSEFYDVDGNGYTDIIGGNSIFFNNGSFTFNEVAINTTPRLYESHYRCTDIEGDGNIDICYVYIASNTHYQEAFYRSENSTGQTINAQQLIWHLWGNEGQVTDFDNDGDIDVSGYELGKAIIWENENDTLYPRFAGEAYDYYTEFLDMVDINSDGYEDMITSTATDVIDEHWYRLNQNGELVGNLNFMLSSEMHLKLIDDIDGDGISELFYHSPGSSNHSILMYRLNTGVPVLSGTLMTWNDFSVEDVVIRLIDYDLDGDKDLVVQHEAGGWEKILMAANNGNNTFTPGQVISCGCAELLDVFDSNGDNLPDLHWHNGDNRIYRNLNTNGTFASATIINSLASGTFSGTKGKAIDIDNDYIMDLVVQSLNKQLIFSNHGNGLSPISNQTATSRLSRVVDLDDDGDMDIAAENIWYENTLISPFRTIGNVYYDVNENGTYESATDIMFPTFPVQLNNGSFIQYTNDDGHFDMSMGSNPGNFAISMANFMTSNFQETTSPYPAIASVDALNPIDSVSIGVKNLNNIIAGEFDVTLSGHRCNESGRLYLNIRNVSPESVSAEVKVVLANNTSYIESNLMASQEADTISWTITDIEPFANVMFHLDLNLPGTSNMGDTMIFISSTVLTGSLGSTTLNDTLKQIVTCAYDPNDKQITMFEHVYSGDTIFSFLDQTEYTIRFQNTGNDTARTVVIKDNLTNLFDHATLRPVSASASYNFSIDSLGIIEVAFEDINLPDSTTDFLGSMGYIKFAVEYAPNSPTFVPVANQARIYFDLNPPIFTNVHRFFRVDCADFINIATQYNLQCESAVLYVENNDFGLPFDYLWTIGSNSLTTEGSAYLPNSGSGMVPYSLQLTNDFCTADSMLNINVLSNPNIQLNMGDSLTCQDYTVYIESDQSVTWWNSIDQTEVTGMYHSIWITEPAEVIAYTTGSNGCSDTVSIILDMIERPSPIHEMDTDPYGYSTVYLCQAQDITLNSNIGDIEWYVWFNSGQPEIFETGSSLNISVQNTETYFQVQNNFNYEGCYFSVATFFNIDPSVELSLFGDVLSSQQNNFCDRDSVAAYTDHLVDWYLNGSFIQNSTWINANQNGTYLAQDDCSHSLSFTVQNNSTFESIETVPVCPGSSYTLPDGTELTNITEPINHISHLYTNYGCDSVITTYLVLDNVVNHSISENGSAITVNSEASTFQWVDCGNNFTPIVGAVQNVYEPSDDGSYAVVLNAYGCTDTSNCLTLGESYLTEIENGNNFICYPNPANEFLNIDFVSPISKINIKLADSFGRTVREIIADGPKQTNFIFELELLPPGFYTLFVLIEGNQFTERIVKI